MKLKTILILLLVCGSGWTAEIGDYTAKAPTDYATATSYPTTYCTYIFSVTGTTNEMQKATLGDLFDTLTTAVIYPLTDQFVPIYDSGEGALADSPAFVNGSSQFAAPILSASSTLIGSATAAYWGAESIINSTSQGWYMGSSPNNGWMINRDNTTSGDLFIQSLVDGTWTNRLHIQDSDGYVMIGDGTPGSPLSIAGGVSIGSASYATAAPSNGVAVEGNAIFNGSIGVATGTPAAELGVAGDIWLTGSVLGPSWNKDFLGPVDDDQLVQSLVSRQPRRYTTWLPPQFSDPQRQAAAETNASRERLGMHISELPEQMRSVDRNGTEMLDFGASIQYLYSTVIEQQKMIEVLRAELREQKR